MSTALHQTFSFSDASLNVALPVTAASTSTIEQTAVFLRNPAPALHIVKIRKILSAGYQDMYYSSRESSHQPLVQIWNLCSRAREWFNECPKDAPSHFSLLYRLECLYTNIILLSTSHRNPVLCDYNKALLFDRCMDFISQIHQVLENPGILPFLTFLDIIRVQQVGHLFVQVLLEDFDFLLSPAVPNPPPVPAGTPDPPILAEEDRINCWPRALRCLKYVRELLQYSSRKWDLRQPLQDFEHDSAPLEKMLREGPSSYTMNQGYPQAPLAANGYPGYPLG